MVSDTDGLIFDCVFLFVWMYRSSIVDFTDADYPASTQDSFGPIMANLNKAGGDAPKPKSKAKPAAESKYVLMAMWQHISVHLFICTLFRL